MVHMCHNKTAEHEEHVNGKITFVNQVSIRRSVKRGERLDTVVVKYDPKCRNPA